MQEDLRELLSQFYERKTGDGKKVSKILKAYSLDEVYEELKNMIYSAYDKNFRWAIHFINYVYCCADYIPGRNDEALTKKILETDMIMEAVSYFGAKKAYARLEFLFETINGLPVRVSKESFQVWMKKYEDENPVMLFTLMGSYPLLNDCRFPKEIYEGLNLGGNASEFPVRYAILQNAYLDSFDKVEYLKRLRDLCPEKYKNLIESKIKENEALLSEDYDYENESAGAAEDEIMNKVFEYFDMCEKMYEENEVLTFEKYWEKVLM